MTEFYTHFLSLAISLINIEPFDALSAFELLYQARDSVSERELENIDSAMNELLPAVSNRGQRDIALAKYAFEKFTSDIGFLTIAHAL